MPVALNTYMYIKSFQVETTDPEDLASYLDNLGIDPNVRKPELALLLPTSIARLQKHIGASRVFVLRPNITLFSTRKSATPM